jgi:hypothetical protein
LLLDLPAPERIRSGTRPMGANDRSHAQNAVLQPVVADAIAGVLSADESRRLVARCGMRDSQPLVKDTEDAWFGNVHGLPEALD